MILVTGATGSVGRNVVRELVNAGEKVRAVTRDPARADLPEGAEVVRGDLLDPATYPAMLADVERLYLFPAGDTVADFVAAAVEAGVRHVVVLSSLAEDGYIGERHRAVERAVEASGAEWTHLRPGAFMGNLRWQWSASIREEGVVRFPYGDASLAPIHEADIAAVAVQALRHEGHAGKAYELSGPEPLTFREQAKVLGRALGRDIEFVELTPEQAQEQMSAAMPAPVADTLLAYWADHVGRTAPVFPAVQQVTGRRGRTLTDWAAENAAAFR